MNILKIKVTLINIEYQRLPPPCGFGGIGGGSSNCVPKSFKREGFERSFVDKSSTKAH